MQIGTITLDSPFVLAPLAGYTDLAFRLLCREHGAGLCYSEMVSGHGIVYDQKKTLDLLVTVAEERPVVMQLFGHDPAIMAEAAARVAELPVDGIDLNMGCPVKKVIRNGAGAALMKDPARAAAMIRGAVRASKLPVTVKIRSGWDQKTRNGIDFALMAQDCGAAAVAVHGRTWVQGFGGRADWGVIRQVKERLSIPVIGNGDVSCYEDGLRMMAETGCDAVMVGRAAIGNPWVFSPGGAPDDVFERAAVLRRHLQLLVRFFPPSKILPKTKNQAGRYFKNIAGGARIRKHLYECSSFSELLLLLEPENLGQLCLG